jgi:hypothetical protein
MFSAILSGLVATFITVFCHKYWDDFSTFILKFLLKLIERFYHTYEDILPGPVVTFNRNVFLHLSGLIATFIRISVPHILENFCHIYWNIFAIFTHIGAPEKLCGNTGGRLSLQDELPIHNPIIVGIQCSLCSVTSAEVILLLKVKNCARF